MNAHRDYWDGTGCKRPDLHINPLNGQTIVRVKQSARLLGAWARDDRDRRWHMAFPNGPCGICTARAVVDDFGSLRPVEFTARRGEPGPGVWLASGIYSGLQA